MTFSDTYQTSKDYQHDREDHQVAAREWYALGAVDFRPNRDPG